MPPAPARPPSGAGVGVSGMGGGGDSGRGGMLELVGQGTRRQLRCGTSGGWEADWQQRWSTEGIQEIINTCEKVLRLEAAQMHRQG